MAESKKAEKQNEEARIPSEDDLRGQSLQDHKRITAEQEGNTTRSEPDRAPAARNKALEEVRQVREDNEKRTRLHSTVGVEREIQASSPSGRSDTTPVSLTTVDGRLYINTHGEKVLDRDQIVDLQHALAAAFQAVS
jgi:hypothetical protein